MILNIAYPDKSQIKFEHRQYPDGQQDIVIEDIEDIEVDFELSDSGFYDVITICSRLNNFKDLELILCATKAMKGWKVLIDLWVPYILGARSDRKFQEGGTSYLRDIVAPIINAQNYNSVHTFDPHSDVMEAVINNIDKFDNVELVQFAISSLSVDTQSFTFVSPDAGSLKKIYNVAKEVNYKGNILVCNKHRDITTGKILSTEVPLKAGEHTHNNFIIIDDICDGGRTFIEIAKEIKLSRPEAKIYLVVTHGIFSAGFKELTQHFEGIFCTNSYSDVGDTWFDGWKTHPTNVKQLNVF